MNFFDQAPAPKATDKGWPLWLVVAFTIIVICVVYLGITLADLASEPQPQTTEVSAK